MRNAEHLTDRPTLFVATFIGAVLGGVLGAALAQDLPPGQLDTVCAAQCAENDNDQEFCTLACWVPDPQFAAPAEPVRWTCFTTCRENSGRPQDCLAACRKR